MKINKDHKIIITGAAGLVGQNLLIELTQAGYSNLVAIDRNSQSLEIARQITPHLRTVTADLATSGTWEAEFTDASAVILLHSEITHLTEEAFIRNNITATEKVLAVCENTSPDYIVHISSSVVVAEAEDHYTETKTKQENLLKTTNIPHCVLRPTLMFGWFDPKHLGWLARFLEKTPVFPLPGDGRFPRQPLYAKDFCRIIQWCLENQPSGQPIYNICGNEYVDYADIIRSIKSSKKLNTWILPIPFSLFRGLMKCYALLFSNPPFTAEQLDALAAGDRFSGEDMQTQFGITPTPFHQAIEDTFTDSRYSHITLQRFH